MYFNMFLHKCFREVLIRVEPTGSTCSDSRVKPATQANIMGLGFAPQDVANQAPDWTLIIGMCSKNILGRKVRGEKLVLYLFWCC